MRRSHGICWTLVVQLLMFCCNSSAPCVVRRIHNGMLYSIPEVQGAKCDDYYWKNLSNRTLATKFDNTSDVLVVNSSDYTLLLKECVEKIFCRQECQDKVHEWTCNTTCSENTGSKDSGGTLDPRWFALIVCVPLLILVIWLIRRTIYNRRRGSHTVVTQEDGQANVDEVNEDSV